MPGTKDYCQTRRITATYEAFLPGTKAYIQARRIANSVIDSITFHHRIVTAAVLETCGFVFGIWISAETQ